MQGTWFERIRDRIRSTWDVLIGRAYAAYNVSDDMGELRLRIALCNLIDDLESEGLAWRASVADARAALGADGEEGR